ncbi:N-acetyltransferase [Sulfurimonas sp. MAG313]|nr:N-acetyltransferase [Sulfurimonas sp. MAG313]MDF1880567.1 N-acetyltransferase [Sulfurimonas sp. MAG313]
MIHYSKANLIHVNQMQSLVQAYVDDGTILERSADEIATNIRSYTLAFEEERLVGFSALHIHTVSLAEIRSLIVHENYRDKGVGKELVSLGLKEGDSLGLKEVLVLTYKQAFFEKLGFVEIPKESLPEHKIWADCIKCKHFPLCNEVSLIKKY